MCKKYVRIDFSRFIFTDKCKAEIDVLEIGSFLKNS